MILSLNEIETTALKAARGAGFAWGLAEEIGVAARVLASCGLDVAPLLAGLLEAHAGGADASACPILIGTRLADQGGLDGATSTWPVVRWPVWIAPFLARVAMTTSTPLALSWPGARLICNAAQDVLSLAVAGEILAANGTPVTISRAIQSTTNLVAHSQSVGERRVDGAAWQRLARLEARTYVPPSRHSREAGAGAGLSDND